MDKDRDSLFVWKNALRGILWLSLFVGLFLFFQKYVDIDYIKWIEPLSENTLLVFFIFIASEVIIGIIPPEVFAIWALRHDNLQEYMNYIVILAFISYLAGFIGYLIGRYLNQSLFYRSLKRRFLKKLDARLNTFGLYLLVVAALTPVPFSGTAMLMGSVKYPAKKYLLYSLTRFLKFAIMAYIFWQSNLNR